MVGSLRVGPVAVAVAVPFLESGRLTRFGLVSEVRVDCFGACDAVGAAARGAARRSRCKVESLRATFAGAAAVLDVARGRLCFAADEAVGAVRWEERQTGLVGDLRRGFMGGLVRGFLLAVEAMEAEERRGLELRESDAALGAVRDVRRVVVSDGLLADHVASGEELPLGAAASVLVESVPSIAAAPLVDARVACDCALTFFVRVTGASDELVSCGEMSFFSEGFLEDDIAGEAVGVDLVGDAFLVESGVLAALPGLEPFLVASETILPASFSGNFDDGVFLAAGEPCCVLEEIGVSERGSVGGGRPAPPETASLSLGSECFITASGS